MDPLSKVQIGKTRLYVTKLGMGGTAVGGLFKDVTEANATGTIKRALRLGINLFDTAPLYGAGKSESRFRHGLQGWNRDSFVMASKVGYALRPQVPGEKQEVFFPYDNPPPLHPVFDFSYDGVMRSVEGSLGRLGLDRIDILHLHDPTDHFEAAMQGAYVALDKLRRERVIGAVGVGTTLVETLIRFVEAGDFDCVLLAGRYTLLEHVALAQALPLCQARKVSVIIGGPYNSGILATGAVAGALYNYVPATPEVLERVRQIEDICRKYSVPLKAAALQFPLAHPAVASIIPGARSEAEVEENFRLVGHPTPAEFWSDLRSQHLLPEEAPVPFETILADSRGAAGK
jgi:D-threo-aldose 1-dehydrogenase